MEKTMNICPGTLIVAQAYVPLWYIHHNYLSNNADSVIAPGDRYMIIATFPNSARPRYIHAGDTRLLVISQHTGMLGWVWYHDRGEWVIHGETKLNSR